jgi:phosphoglycolate phosphatase-like HAD superfamily hydrolase
MLSALRCHGVCVERCYACLDDPHNGKGKHQRDSVFLLPNTGAMYHARQHDGVHLGESWVIGDSTPELAAGWRAGCRTAGVRTGQACADGTLEIDVEFQAANLAEALDEILQLTRAAGR